MCWGLRSGVLLLDWTNSVGSVGIAITATFVAPRVLGQLAEAGATEVGPCSSVANLARKAKPADCRIARPPDRLVLKSASLPCATVALQADLTQQPLTCQREAARSRPVKLDRLGLGSSSVCSAARRSGAVTGSDDLAQLNSRQSAGF